MQKTYVLLLFLSTFTLPPPVHSVFLPQQFIDSLQFVANLSPFSDIRQIFGGAKSSSGPDEIAKQWTEYKQQFNKSYGAEEDIRRQGIFANRLVEIEKHNEAFSRKLEFDELPLSRKSAQVQLNSSALFSEFFDNATEVPDSLDWRQRGYVTPVKDQGSTTNYAIVNRQLWHILWILLGIRRRRALEALVKQKTGKLISLSEQEIVDCEGEDDCFGGFPYEAYDYVKDHGIVAGVDYPYIKGMHVHCLLNKSMPNVLDHIRGYGQIEPKEDNEEQLKILVALKGPVSAGLTVHQAFADYAGGVFYDPTCKPTEKPNHAIVIVGYGTDSQLGDYWIVKNSAGTSWGEEGYFRMARNRHNNCRFGLDTTYPIP